MVSDLVELKVDRKGYLTGQIQLARLWTRRGAEELEWFLASMRGEVVRNEPLLGRGVLPASPAVPLFGKRRCDCCRRPGATGWFEAQFLNKVELLSLCPPCEFSEAYAKWNGQPVNSVLTVMEHGKPKRIYVKARRKLISLRLVATYVYATLKPED